MKNTSLILSAFITCTIFISGCNTQPSVNRTYNADYNSTFASAVKSVETITNKPPFKIDPKTGTIITELAFGDVKEELCNGSDCDDKKIEYKKKIDSYQATIKVISENSQSTRVSINIQQGFVNTYETKNAFEDKPKVGAGIVFGNSDSSISQKYFDQIDLELKKLTLQNNSQSVK